jgi:hypothetical protein
MTIRGIHARPCFQDDLQEERGQRREEDIAGLLLLARGLEPTIEAIRVEQMLQESTNHDRDRTVLGKFL